MAEVEKTELPLLRSGCMVVAAFGTGLVIGALLVVCLSSRVLGGPTSSACEILLGLCTNLQSAFTKYMIEEWPTRGLRFADLTMALNDWRMNEHTDEDTLLAYLGPPDLQGFSEGGKRLFVYFYRGEGTGSGTQVVHVVLRGSDVLKLGYNDAEVNDYSWCSPYSRGSQRAGPVGGEQQP